MKTRDFTSAWDVGYADGARAERQRMRRALRNMWKKNGWSNWDDMLRITRAPKAKRKGAAR